MQVLELKFTTVDCSSCTDTIQEYLLDNKSILDIDFDILEQTGTISYDENLVSEKEILKKLKKIGYPAYVI